MAETVVEARALCAKIEARSDIFCVKSRALAQQTLCATIFSSKKLEGSLDALETLFKLNGFPDLSGPADSEVPKDLLVLDAMLGSMQFAANILPLHNQSEKADRLGTQVFQLRVKMLGRDHISTVRSLCRYADTKQQYATPPF